MSRRGCLLTAVLATGFAAAAPAADTCECPDIADLRNREAEERAAIQAYRDAIGRWGSSAPEANRTSRQDFQDNVIQPAINGVLIDGWSFEPRSGVYAEKIITGTCGWGVRRSAVAHQRAAVVVFHYRYQ